MKEIKEILQAYEAACDVGKQVALATVVHVEGSSYRRPGARMLITEDGQLTGAISGGCLEGDALRKAFLVMMQKATTLVTYDTNDEDDATLGLGLGCNGIIQVLIEPINPNEENNPIQLLRHLASQRQQGSLVTLFSLTDKKSHYAGTWFLVTEKETIFRNNTPLNERFVEDARKVLNNEQSEFKTYISGWNTISAFIEFVNRPISIIVAGAGNDVQPLIQMASLLGWDTTVVDGRPDYASTQRFLPSCKVLVAKPHEILNTIAIDQQTVFLLMTHNYNYDKSLLQLLLQKKLSYIGMLGPRNKFQRMLSEYKEEGIEISEQQLATVHSPVGLDLGADTPQEIALSILAEIKAILSTKAVLPLKDKAERIHSGFDSKMEEVRLHHH